MGLKLWVKFNRHRPSFDPTAAKSFHLTPKIYYDCWYRGEIKIKNCSTWNHAEGCMYLLPPLNWDIPVLIAGENSVGNSHYEQLAQLWIVACQDRWLKSYIKTFKQRNSWEMKWKSSPHDEKSSYQWCGCWLNHFSHLVQG